MTATKSLLCFLVIVAGTANAFTTTTPAFCRQVKTVRSRGAVLLFAGQSDKEGGAAIAKPKVNIGQKTALVTETKSRTAQKRAVKRSEPQKRREEEFEDAPLYKVLLIGDDDYDQTHVIQRMCDILEDMDENHASTVFKQAQQNGKAMCGKYPFEYAELYKEQFIRSDPMIFSDVEEENEGNSGKGRAKRR